MKTQTVGELLATAREKKAISLESLSEKTKIRLQYLEALENNDFDALPESVFVKAYIRNYARELDLELAPLLAILRRDYEESSKGQLIPREYLFPLIKKKQFWSPVRMLALTVLSAFILVFSYAAWQWYQLNRPPILYLESPQESMEVSGQVLVKGRTDPDVILLINGQPVALRTDGSFLTELSFLEEGPINIQFDVTDRNGKKTELNRSVIVRF